ncbi:MAG: hypothetical protein DMG82_02320 [Acidobacteria bacterium]|nr:MAG: hypothetical protein DMG82_02320 [Acidobacteriota bacterium]
MSYITRRELLRMGAQSLGFLAAGGCLGRFSRLYAAASETNDYRALVCIFMLGGNDGNNLIVPIKTEKQSYSDYIRVRGTIAGLPQNSLGVIATANGKEMYGLHARLDRLRDLYSRGKLAVVANVGTLVRPISREQYQQGAAVPLNLFSHSDQQQQWQMASIPGAPHNGWAGRAADLVSIRSAPSRFPIGVSTAGNSLFLTGELPEVSIINGQLGLDGSDGSIAENARDAAFQQIVKFPTGMALIQKANQVAADGLNAAKELNGALSAGSSLKTPFPSTSLGKQLQQVARVMNVRKELGAQRQIFYVAIGDFDTHTDSMRRQDVLLADMAASMSAFYDATVEMQIERQVVTFTESEFGRTLQPSSGAGTDHAWGSHHLVMGGAVKAADVYGVFPVLALQGPEDVTGRGVWVPTISLDQYGATLASWFGVADDSLTKVFPNLGNFSPRKLAFV